MGDGTKIQWCDYTFNPWIGCSKVATGCVNCYAEADFDKRRKRAKWGPNGTRVLTSEANWKKPLKWNREATPPAVPVCAQCGADARHSEPFCPECDYGIDRHRPRVFCGSLCDVFEDWRGDAQQKTPRGIRIQTLHNVRQDLFRLIDQTQNLDWLLLTKRPENVGQMWQMVAHRGNYVAEAGAMNDYQMNYRPNVWLGCSVSDQSTADAMMPELLRLRDLVPVLFLSIEPLTGPVVLADNVRPYIDWVIVGGESGPRSRPCNIAWIRSIVQQCKGSGVPCFVKQLGAHPVRTVSESQATKSCVGITTRIVNWLRDPKGGDPAEWPEDCRVREFPTVAVA